MRLNSFFLFLFFSFSFCYSQLTKSECAELVTSHQSERRNGHYSYVFDLPSVRFGISRLDSLALHPYLDDVNIDIRRVMNCVSEHYHDWVLRVGDRNGNNVDGASAIFATDRVVLYFDSSDLDQYRSTDYGYGTISVGCQYFTVTVKYDLVHYYRSDSYLSSLVVTDALTRVVADGLYVSKVDFNSVIGDVSMLLGKVLKPVVPSNFIVHGYNTVFNELYVGYRGPFEYCIYHKDFNPFGLLLSGRSGGGDNVGIDLSSLSSGSYWVVIIYAGESFRIEVNR